MASAAKTVFSSMKLMQLKKRCEATLFERDLVVHSTDEEIIVRLKELEEEGASDHGEWYVSISWVAFNYAEPSGITTVRSPEVPGLDLAVFCRQRGHWSYILKDPIAIRLGNDAQLPSQLTLELDLFHWKDPITKATVFAMEKDSKPSLRSLKRGVGERKKSRELLRNNSNRNQAKIKAALGIGVKILKVSLPSSSAKDNAGACQSDKSPNQLPTYWEAKSKT